MIIEPSLNLLLLKQAIMSRPDPFPDPTMTNSHLPKGAGEGDALEISSFLISRDGSGSTWGK